MEVHRRFIDWAKTRGVEECGITAHQFPHSGLGIIAETDLESQTTILTVPTSALVTLDNLPKKLLEKFPINTTTHALLAAYLCLPSFNHELDPWLLALPPATSFQVSMPLTWPDELQQHLPSRALKLITDQKAKIAKDWRVVSEAFPEITYEIFVYRWLLVNTRTFYYQTPSQQKMRKGNLPARNDCMALNPVADYFNHSATANATAECTDGAYRIRTTASVQKGEEIFISYGRHSNDFLLAEYGFVLDENDWDEVDISDFVEPLFDEMQTRLLKENHFLGNYILDRNGACHRTEITLRLLGMNERRWMRSVNGTEDSQSTQRDVDARLIEVISSLQSTVDHHVKSLGCSQRDTLDQTILIEKRWMQISALLDKIMLRLTEPL